MRRMTIGQIPMTNREGISSQRSVIRKRQGGSTLLVIEAWSLVIALTPGAYASRLAGGRDRCGTIACPPHASTALAMPWSQTTLDLPPLSRGFHLITRRVVEALPPISQTKVGLLHVFIQHTSASLTLNENADPDVRHDLEQAFNDLAPESFPHTHTCEGPDDMPAHVKASLLGASLSIPVRDGRLALGTWQGITLCEHRNHAGGRRVVLTLMGD